MLFKYPKFINFFLFLTTLPYPAVLLDNLILSNMYLLNTVSKLINLYGITCFNSPYRPPLSSCHIPDYVCTVDFLFLCMGAPRKTKSVL